MNSVMILVLVFLHVLNVNACSGRSPSWCPKYKASDCGYVPGVKELCCELCGGSGGGSGDGGGSGGDGGSGTDSALGCGTTPIRPNLSGYIVGGVETRKHSIPWQIGFLKHNWQMCGGSIINSRTIVTAAHCYGGEDPGYFEIVVGQHSKKSPDQYTKKYKVTNIINHPQWDRRTLSNDIAIIKTADDIKFNDAVQPICLPPKDTKYADGANFLVSGWGKTVGNDRRSSSDVLKQAILPNHDPASCFWGRWSKYESRINDGKLICAGWNDGSHGTCQGDSGGPLVKMVSGKWYLAGVVSFGNRGCSTDGMYTNVIDHLDFIQQHS